MKPFVWWFRTLLRAAADIDNDGRAASAIVLAVLSVITLIVLGVFALFWWPTAVLVIGFAATFLTQLIRLVLTGRVPKGWTR